MYGKRKKQNYDKNYWEKVMMIKLSKNNQKNIQRNSYILKRNMIAIHLNKKQKKSWFD